jgi:hypothetical protein
MTGFHIDPSCLNASEVDLSLLTRSWTLNPDDPEKTYSKVEKTPIFEEKTNYFSILLVSETQPNQDET